MVSRLGLNDKEAGEFVSYWQDRLDIEVKSKYIFTGVILQEEIDRVVPLSLNPEAKTLIRIRTYFKPVDKLYNIKNPILPETPERKGFTVVEWGGILDM